MPGGRIPLRLRVNVMTENIIIAAIIVLGLFVAGPMLLYYLIFGKLS